MHSLLDGMDVIGALCLLLPEKKEPGLMLLSQNGKTNEPPERPPKYCTCGNGSGCLQEGLWVSGVFMPVIYLTETAAAQIYTGTVNSSRADSLPNQCDR